MRSFFQNLKTNLKRDFKLLYNFYFLICTFTYINFILDFVAFIIILPDVAKDQGIPGKITFLEYFFLNLNNSLDVDSKWLLSIFSITDFVGRIGPGWLSYWKIISDKSIYVLSITIMGICMIWLILVQTWLQFVLVSLLCGLVTGCQMVLSPAILADYLGTENTAVTFGMANFICGLMTLVTRPMIIGLSLIYLTKIIKTNVSSHRCQGYLWWLQDVRLCAFVLRIAQWCTVGSGDCLPKIG